MVMVDYSYPMVTTTGKASGLTPPPMVGKHFTIPQRDELLWVAVDLDGTLAESIWPTEGIGAPIWENIAKVHHIVAEGYKVVIHTARPYADYELVESWLRRYGVPFRHVVCGKLLAAAYVDDRAIHASSQLWVPGSQQ